MMPLMSISARSEAGVGSLILSSSEPKIILYSPSRSRFDAWVGRQDFMKIDPVMTVPMATYLRYFEQRRAGLVETIRQMAEMESPSFNKAAVDLLGAWLAAPFQKLRGAVRGGARPRLGNQLQVDLPATRAASRKL